MKVLVAGGGTGGHLYPGIALAEELRVRGADVRFVGTERGIEVRAVPKAGFPLDLITVSGLKRMGLVKMVQGMAKLPVSFGQCMSILSAFAPDVVVGVGGYASGPVVMTAWMRGIPTAILEQNSIPGFTNKILGRVVRRVFGSFEKSRAFFPAEKFTRAGNPVRAQLVAASGSTGKGILVLGGSQGARILNEVLPGALKVALGAAGAVPVVHQCGEKDVEATRARYAEAGVAADVRSFIDDMGAAYADALLCVCRSGATTCAELTVLGRPSVLVPFEAAADDHQTHNARELEQAGAALVVAQRDATPDHVGSLVAELLKDRARLARMATSATTIGKPRATQEIVDELYQLAGQQVPAAAAGVRS